MTQTNGGAETSGEGGVTRGVARVGDLDIGYDVRGAGEPLLLVPGFGMPRAMWSEELCGVLASRGFRVVRMDNRDTGASTRMTSLGVPRVGRLLLRSVAGLSLDVPYRLEDMARDAVGLMAGLGFPRFHVVGASMGGMIAQTMALEHPGSLSSLTSIMSTPGGRRYAVAQPMVLRGILERVPAGEAAQVEHFFRLFRVIAGDGTPFDAGRGRATAEAVVASKPSASGSARQFAAILESSGRRRARLPGITTPTLVIHGTHDPLLPLRGSRAMAKLVPGAELLVVEGMGHLIPASRYPLVADAIARAAARARSV